MITLYYLQSNASSRNAMWFLKHHGLPFRRVIMNHDLTLGDITFLASKAGGIDTLIAPKSKHYIEYIKLRDNEDTTLFQLYDFIIKHPRVLKGPIIYDDVKNHMEIGYNEENITTFLPREEKKKAFLHTLEIARGNDAIERAYISRE